jgi:ureidoglycolate dehydrogenase (NAD+)
MLHTPDVPSDSGQEIVVSADVLKQLMIDILVKKGMFAAEAEICASRMIESDLRGIHSHGSRAVKRYVEWMDDGDIDPRAQILTVRETAAMAVLDGGSGMGHVAATKAIQMAIQKAKEVGTGTVAIKNGQHYGASAVYAMMAVEAGMIGYTTTNTGPATVAAYGSRQGAVANNAFAWGVPTPSGPPFVLDMACAVSSWGKVESLKLYGGSLPENWALDADGNPTVDPNAAKTLLPAAGARGYGLAFVSSVLAGTLVGGRMPFHKTRSPAADKSEHFFYAIDLTQFVDPEDYNAEIEATIADIHTLAPSEGFDKVRLPGELEWERTERWKAEGIPIHRDHANRLEETAKALNIELPW